MGSRRAYAAKRSATTNAKPAKKNIRKAVSLSPALVVCAIIATLRHAHSQVRKVADPTDKRHKTMITPFIEAGDFP